MIGEYGRLDGSAAAVYSQDGLKLWIGTGVLFSLDRGSRREAVA